ncbi:bifunctional adenosylcobinamide kinase/adenosylcobinamide-phosphate guanylyltransferase [Oceanobacillus sp. CAU 1775]
MEKSRMIFVTGGARSGKSSFAERYAATNAVKERRKLYYLATAKFTDDEIKDRIRRHQIDRSDANIPWKTVESSFDISRIVNEFTRGSIVLLDCVTILLANELFDKGFYEEDVDYALIERQVFTSIMDGIEALSNRVGLLIIVSNEVAYEPIHKEHAVVIAYRKLLGRIHQNIVKKSNEAYLIECGLPIQMKGEQICEGL